jgi:hypothetical protein
MTECGEGRVRYPRRSKVYPRLMPSEARRTYGAHHHNAERRGIAWGFTPETWWAWWQRGDRWSRRGRGADGLVMARWHDQGAYEPGNVYATTQRDNAADITPETRCLMSQGIRASWAARKARGEPWHLAVRGDGHPCSKAVLTPKGRFGSGRLAAEAHGIAAGEASRRARRQTHGWRYEADAAPAAAPQTDQRPTA